MRSLDRFWNFRTLLALGIFLGISYFAYWRGTGIVPTDKIGSWYSIVPPLIAITLALITHEIISSLLIAVVVGGLLVTVPESPLSVMSWAGGIGIGAKYIYGATFNEINFLILLFVTIVMAMISVLLVCGGLQGMVKWLAKFVKGKRSAQLMTSLAGIAMFIDDYANTMLIGASMKPVTDAHNVSREKLSFLVDATSAPVAGLAVVSTWIGYEVGLFGEVSQTLSLGVDGYAMFFDALPFRFYCILMILFVLINSVSGEDFGPMAAAQKRAETHGKLYGDDAKPLTSKLFANLQIEPNARVRGVSAAIPIVFLLIFLMGGLWVDGKGASFGPITSLGAWESAITGSQNSILLLAYAATFGTLVASLCAIFIAKCSLASVLRAIGRGFYGSILPIAILVLAWSLKSACDGLLTGGFLAATIGGHVSALYYPALVFVVSGLTAFSTGTSWGTMAILIPTAIPVAYQLDGNLYGITTIMSLAAVLDGSIFGDHCSPISDTTILSSIASDCDHIHHVRTQMPYAILVALAALFLGYVPSAAGISSWIGVALSAGIFILIFLFIGGRKRRLSA